MCGCQRTLRLGGDLDVQAGTAREDVDDELLRQTRRRGDGQQLSPHLGGERVNVGSQKRRGTLRVRAGAADLPGDA